MGPGVVRVPRVVNSVSGRALAAALVVLLLGLSGCSDDTSSSGSGDRGSDAAATDGGSGAAGEHPDRARFVAEAIVPSVAVYDTVDATAPATALSNPNENGAPLVFLMVDRSVEQGRVHVMLPLRPNGRTGWVARSDVEVTRNPYRIEVALSAHRLKIFNLDQVMLDEPVAIGTVDTPTPGGEFYITELLQPPDPTGPNGPYAYGLSGFSNQLTSFAGGDGVVGIHGTNDPASIGTDVSHGCIRLRNEAITSMVDYLPLGTPVVINA
jgi:lipoprotein-anchoring transpeptidase ErfK/SrfK